MSHYKSQEAFLSGELIQMHTIHESNYRAIKQLRNGNKKRKNNNKNSLLKLSSTANGMDALDDFYTHYAFVG